MAQQVYLAVGSLNREAPYFQGARGEGLTIFAFDETTLECERLTATKQRRQTQLSSRSMLLMVWSMPIPKFSAGTKAQ